MDPATTLRKLGKLEYAAARLPFSLLDDYLARYWDDDAAARVGFERWLGTLDLFAGRMLADDAIRQRGQVLCRSAGADVWAQATAGEAAAGVVLLRPASPGTGVIAGGPVRAVLECAGIHDVLSRSLGSSNPINVVHATVAALKGLSRPEEIAAKRGLPIEDVAPAAMLRARAAAAS